MIFTTSTWCRFQCLSDTQAMRFLASCLRFWTLCPRIRRTYCWAFHRRRSEDDRASLWCSHPYHSRFHARMDAGMVCCPSTGSHYAALLCFCCQRAVPIDARGTYFLISSTAKLEEAVLAKMPKFTTTRWLSMGNVTKFISQHRTRYWITWTSRNRYANRQNSDGWCFRSFMTSQQNPTRAFARFKIISICYRTRGIGWRHWPCIIVRSLCRIHSSSPGFYSQQGTFVFDKFHGCDEAEVDGMLHSVGAAVVQLHEDIFDIRAT
eukprot:IDg12873t1